VLREGLDGGRRGEAGPHPAVGTNLALADLADDFSAVFGVPVIAINAALYWHALRICDIADRRIGFGPLLRNH